MQSSEDYDLHNAFSLLIQGQTGTGKTSLLLEFPNVYVADLDNNLSGAVRRLRARGDKRVFKYDTIDQMRDPKSGLIVERPLKDRLPFLNKCLAEAAADPWVKTIGIDGCSKLNAYIIADIGRQQPMVGNRSRHDGEMTLADWGSHLYMWQNYVTKLLTTPKMIVFTAHEEASDRTDLQGMLISIQGKKAQAQLGGMFSDVWRTEVEQKLVSGGYEYNFKVRTMPTATLALKNSLALPDSFKMEWQKIKEKLGVKDTPVPPPQPTP